MYTYSKRSHIIAFRIFVVLMVLIGGAVVTKHVITSSMAAQEQVRSDEIISKEAGHPKETIKVPEDTFVDRKLLKSFVQDQNYKVFPALADIIIEAVFQASEKYKIPPIVLFSLVKVESDFDYSCVSKTGAIGLTQISKVWLDPNFDKSLVTKGIIKNKKELYDPTKNIIAGGYILKHYIIEGESRKEANPIRYGVTRYLGGYKNDHYNNLITAIGEYYVHSLLVSR